VVVEIVGESYVVECRVGSCIRKGERLSDLLRKRVDHRDDPGFHASRMSDRGFGTQRTGEMNRVDDLPDGARREYRHQEPGIHQW